MLNYDLAVIGTGPGGRGAAIQAAKLGKKVAVIEKQPLLGGVSVNTGTIPSKALRQAILYLTGYFQRGIYGENYRLKQQVTISDLNVHTQKIVKERVITLEDQYRRNNVDIHFGQASFLGSHLLKIDLGSSSQTINANKIVIATGSKPAKSKTVPINQTNILDSDGILQLKSIPDSLVVVGGGIIGMEYASFFSTLGTEVTVIDIRENILPFLDNEISMALQTHLEQKGMVFHLGEMATKVTQTSGRIETLTDKNNVVYSEALLYAIGRIGMIEELGLTSLGIESDIRGKIHVNENFQTNVSHIYAVGDVIGPPALAATSQEQGRCAARHAFGLGNSKPAELLPIAIYTIPEISMVGRTETELRNRSIPYEVGIGMYADTARGKIIGDSSGKLKLLFNSTNHKLLGVHIIGEGASELVHIGQIGLAMGTDLDYFVDNVFNYPTLAECYRIAALDALNKLC